MDRVKQFLFENGIIVVFIFVLLIFSVFVPSFFSISNIFNVLRQITIFGTIALGVTYVVIAGKLDLSVGSMLSLLTVFSLDMINKVGPVMAILLTLIVAIILGSINGFIVGYLKLNYFIGTLAMLSILQGVTLFYSGGKNIDVVNQDIWYKVIGQGYVGPFPIPFIIFLVIVVILQFFLDFTALGRKIYSVGGNAVAATYSGVCTPRIIFFCYIISALTTAVAAFILGSRVMGTQNNVGENYELIVLSAIILGGTSLLGGSGNVIKTVIGVMILGFMQNGLLLLGAYYYVQWIISFLLIIMVSGVDINIRKKVSGRV